MPAPIELTARKATALESNKSDEWGAYFELPDLYFAESQGDKMILKAGIAGTGVTAENTVLSASQTDWSLFNNVAEHWKCAQVVLYEALNKPSGAAVVRSKVGENKVVMSVIDYTITTKETTRFWESLFRVMGIHADPTTASKKNSTKEHNLLLDGPVD